MREKGEGFYEVWVPTKNKNFESKDSLKRALKRWHNNFIKAARPEEELSLNLKGYYGVLGAKLRTLTGGFDLCIDQYLGRCEGKCARKHGFSAVSKQAFEDLEVDCGFSEIERQHVRNRPSLPMGGRRRFVTEAERRGILQRTDCYDFAVGDCVKHPCDFVHERKVSAEAIKDIRATLEKNPMPLDSIFHGRQDAPSCAILLLASKEGLKGVLDTLEKTSLGHHYRFEEALTERDCDLTLREGSCAVLIAPEWDIREIVQKFRPLLLSIGLERSDMCTIPDLVLEKGPFYVETFLGAQCRDYRLVQISVATEDTERYPKFELKGYTRNKNTHARETDAIERTHVLLYEWCGRTQVLQSLVDALRVQVVTTIEDLAFDNMPKSVIVLTTNLRKAMQILTEVGSTFQLITSCDVHIWTPKGTCGFGPKKGATCDVKDAIHVLGDRQATMNTKQLCMSYLRGCCSSNCLLYHPPNAVRDIWSRRPVGPCICFREGCFCSGLHPSHESARSKLLDEAMELDLGRPRHAGRLQGHPAIEMYRWNESGHKRHPLDMLAMSAHYNGLHGGVRRGCMGVCENLVDPLTAEKRLVLKTVAHVGMHVGDGRGIVKSKALLSEDMALYNHRMSETPTIASRKGLDDEYQYVMKERAHIEVPFKVVCVASTPQDSVTVILPTEQGGGLALYGSRVATDLVASGVVKTTLPGVKGCSGSWMLRDSPRGIANELYQAHLTGRTALLAVTGLVSHGDMTPSKLYGADLYSITAMATGKEGHPEREGISIRAPGTKSLLALLDRAGIPRNLEESKEVDGYQFYPFGTELRDTLMSVDRGTFAGEAQVQRGESTQEVLLDIPVVEDKQGLLQFVRKKVSEKPYIGTRGVEAFAMDLLWSAGLSKKEIRKQLLEMKLKTDLVDMVMPEGALKRMWEEDNALGPIPREVFYPALTSIPAISKVVAEVRASPYSKKFMEYLVENGYSLKCHLPLKVWKVPRRIQEEIRDASYKEAILKVARGKGTHIDVASYLAELRAST